MIKVSRLNGKRFTINALYIEMIESLPDTTITFTNGKKIVVLEKEEQVVREIKNFYKEVNVLGVCNNLEDINHEE
ncbi:flagellar FlbD family protein [Bacillus massiliglaciei]|uniref:flagellar FlbD family protein n=1 Tax=Bacillus massiliglaciei TaxID=1816693 RepID=UPI000DA5F131|nr:flagellar FlbD family protein [Bacillus massiliglaciei]